MDFLKKSLFRKYIVSSVFFFLLAFGAAIFLAKFFPDKSNGVLIFGEVLGVLLIISILFYYKFFQSPLRKIMQEMKAMLAGKKYLRIYTQRLDELGVLSHFFNEVTKNLERISIAVKEGKRMSSELTIGAEIQKMVLPAVLSEVPGLDIYVRTRAAVEIGGDNYDVNRAHNNAYIYVGDATGHGVPAGLVMIMVNTLIDTFTEIYQNAYDVIVQTNRLLKQRIQTTMFMTLMMLRYNEIEKKMYYVGCGHEYILTFRKNTGVCDAKPSGGIALGMVPDNSKIVKEELLPCDTGDFVLLYSDGIIEARNTSGEEFGLKRLKEAIEKFAPASKTSQELFTLISTEFGKFVENQVQNDDITLMVIRRI